MTSFNNLIRCSVPGSSRQLIKALKLSNNYFKDQIFYSEMNMKDPWVKNLVDNFGFSIFTSETFDKKKILINKRKKLVVKVMYSIGSIPKHRPPTKLIFNIANYANTRYDLVLQSLVNISQKAKNKAKSIIENSQNHDIKYGFDTHYNNYGLYKNKVVVFDW